MLDRVAGVVNDEIVTLGEVYELGKDYIDEAVTRDGAAARAVAERDVLERLIERRLVAQEMANLKLDLTEQEIDRSIDDIARRNGLDRDGLRAEIERSGIGWDQYRAELRENLRDVKFAQAVLRPRITITDDELKDAWLRANQDAPQVTHLQAIFLAFPKDAAAGPEGDAVKGAVVARAEGIRAEVAGGGDFAALATKYDEGPFGAHAGEMGTFKPGELVDELDHAMVATAVGQVSEPVLAGQGVFLLRVVERTTSAVDFASMKDQLSDQVFGARMEDEKERWFQQARRRAAVRVLLPEASSASR